MEEGRSERRINTHSLFSTYSKSPSFLGYFFAYEASRSKRSRNSHRLRLAHACQVSTAGEAAGDGTNSGVGVHDF